MIALFEDVWGDVIALCDGLSDEQWARPTDCPGWSVQDNVAHMIGTELMLGGGQPSANDDVGEAPHVRNDIGKANERWIASYRDMAGAAVLDEFRSVTARRLDDLRALTGADWDREGFTPEGPGPYRQFMAIRVFDCWYHDEDIREALDRPGYLEGPVADHSLAASRPRACPMSSARRQAHRRARRSCSTWPAPRRSSHRSSCRPKGGRCCSTTRRTLRP